MSFRNPEPPGSNIHRCWNLLLGCGGGGGPCVPPVFLIDAVPDAGEAPLDVQFAANEFAGTGPFTFLWDFGDGETSNLQNPLHTYTEPGSYFPTLTVTNACGESFDDGWEIIASAGVCAPSQWEAVGELVLDFSDSPSPRIAYGVAFGIGDLGPRWVIAGEGKRLVFSDDNGLTWQECVHSSTRSFTAGVRFGNGVWIAGGQNGAVWRSTDGENFADVTPSGTNPAVQGLCYNPNADQWIYCNGNADMFVSTDGGINWTETNNIFVMIAGDFNGPLRIRFDAEWNRYVAVANLRISTAEGANPLVWTNRVNLAPGSDVVFTDVCFNSDDGIQMAVGWNNTLYRSVTGGATWTDIGNSRTTSFEVYSCIWRCGVMVQTWSDGQIDQSLDNGDTWGPLTGVFWDAPLDLPQNDIDHDPDTDIFLAVGLYGRVYRGTRSPLNLSGVPQPKLAFSYRQLWAGSVDDICEIRFDQDNLASWVTPYVDPLYENSIPALIAVNLQPPLTDRVITTVSGNPTCPINDTTDIFVGELITGLGLLAMTLVTSINPGVSINVSPNPNLNNAGVPVVLTPRAFGTRWYEQGGDYNVMESFAYPDGIGVMNTQQPAASYASGRSRDSTGNAPSMLTQAPFTIPIVNVGEDLYWMLVVSADNLGRVGCGIYDTDFMVNFNLVVQGSGDIIVGTYDDNTFDYCAWEGSHVPSGKEIYEVYITAAGVATLLINGVALALTPDAAAVPMRDMNGAAAIDYSEATYAGVQGVQGIHDFLVFAGADIPDAAARTKLRRNAAVFYGIELP